MAKRSASSAATADRPAPTVVETADELTPAAVASLTAETTATELDEAVATGDQLIKQCSKVRVRTSWFSTSAKVADDMAVAMLKETEADRKMVAISKRFLNTKHDALEGVKAARNAIQSYVTSMTVPLLALRTAADSEAGMQKDAGIRLIKKDDMEAFDDRIHYLIGVLHTAVAALQDALPEIKREEEKRLGRLYNERDYPEDITKLVSVTVGYEPVGVDLDWEKLCPQIYEREARNARLKFAAVAENAAQEFSQAFVAYVSQVVDQLGNRVRLNPKPGEGWERYQDAEVLEKVEHGDDPEVPAGHVLVKVRLKKEAGARGRSEDVWLPEPISKNRYQAELRPYETSEQKKLFGSTVDNLKAQMERFLNVGDMLGPHRALIAESVARVQQLLASADSGMDGQRIANELRSGNAFRNQVRDALAGVADEVRDVMSDAKKVRRKISSNLIGKV